uniref:Putative deoxyribonuclease i n=1 Tax=Phlebotomus kandelakii TaxID=1109342 RepID=A0A6B2EAJ4_9DIPT
MLKAIFSAIFLLGIIFQSQGLSLGSDSNCHLPLKPVAYGFFAPLVFNADDGKFFGQFSFTTNDTILLSAGDSVIVSCMPGYFKSFPKLKFLKAKCVEGEVFELEDGKRESWSKSFACELRVVEEIIAPRLEGCPEAAQSIEFGFINPHTRTSNIVGEACYSVQEGRTIFAHMRDPSVVRIEDTRYLSSGRHPEGRDKINLFRALRQDRVNDLLQERMGRHGLPMIGSRPLLTGQMLDYPQLHLITRLTWNYAITHNDDSMQGWNNLQSDVEKQSRKEDVEVWVGSSGVQTLKDLSGQSFDFYLDEKKFPVPKYLWLVVKIADKTSGFLFSNTPHNLKTEICSDSCSAIDWISHPEANDLQCCSLEKLRQIVPEIPQNQISPPPNAERSV